MGGHNGWACAPIVSAPVSGHPNGHLRRLHPIWVGPLFGAKRICRRGSLMSAYRCKVDIRQMVASVG